MKMCNKISAERIAQILLFALLPLIDLYRNAGTVEQMMIATQGIGLVMAGVLITHYGFKAFMKLYNLIWILICAGGIYAIFRIYSNLTQAVYYQRECWLMCLNFCLFGMVLTKIIIDLIQCKENVLIKARKFMCWQNIPFFIWLGYIVIATCTRENIFRPGCDLIYFGLFFLVSYSREELQNLYTDFANGILLGFWLLQGYAFLRRPWVDSMMRYRGMYYNSNIYDIICLLVLLLLLLKMTQVRREKTLKHWQYWFWLLQYGMVFSPVVISVGRVAIVLATAGTIIYGVITIISLEHKKISKIFWLGVICFLSVCIMFPVTFAGASYLPRIKKSPVSFQAEYYSWGDLNNPENYVSLKEFGEMSLGRLELLFTDYKAPQPVADDVNDIANEKVVDERPMDPNWKDKTYFLDEENYNAVELRIAIGLTYLVELNMWGHTTEEWWLWVAPHKPQIHAHNVLIMEAFIYGIPAGIFFALYMISCIVLGIKKLMKDKENMYALFPFFAVVLSLGLGIFEMTWQPGQISWFVIFFAMRFLLKEKEVKVPEKAVVYCVYRFKKANNVQDSDDVVAKWKQEGYSYSEKLFRGEKRLLKAILLFMIETGGKYRIKCLDDKEGLVHYSFIIPYCRKFSFMKKHDYQIGPCYTREDCRGKNIYPDMLMQISKEILEESPDSDIYVLIREQNEASLKGIAKADFEMVGRCTKTPMLKHYKECEWV